MEVQTFLPRYPDMHPTSSLYDLYEGEHFNQIIFGKKEFYDLKLSAIQPEQPPDGVYYNHQKIIARFLASYTLYNELLLFHSPGTGKSVSAIAAIENIIHYKFNGDRSIKRAIIIVPNEDLLEKFRWEIIHVGTRGKYFPEDEEEDVELTEHELRVKRFKRGKKIMRPFYMVTTHEQFYNSVLSKSSLSSLKKKFSNSVIVIDEAHRIANNKTWYKSYDNFLHVIENRKIILMTGTPMKNQSFEIANIMNLILPMELQLPTYSAFDKAYLDAEGFVLDEKAEELSQRFLGRVSYLKSKVNIDYEFQGVYRDPMIPSYPLFPSIMSPFQTKYYNISTNTENKEEKDESFYNHSLQASLFVYPDGSSGTTGSNTYIKKSGNNYSKPRFLKDISGNYDNKLNQLDKYSTKYANTIRNILNNPKQNCFVYTSSISGSGAIIFGMCLELFGYSRAIKKSDIRGKRKRYAILADSTGTDTKAILESFNRQSNKNGEFIQILIGGKKIEEGVTFYSIQQIHVLTPHWNFSSMDQAIARGIRMRAHRFLDKNTMVKIYLHVSLPADKSEQIPTDVKLYQMSQYKDLGIKNIEYIIKTTSFDCALTFDRNVDVNGTDNSRECEYTDCIYRCKGVNYPYIIAENKLNKDTYQIYYEDYYQERLIQLLQSVFRKQFSITLWKLSDYFDQSYTLYQIFQALSNIIKMSIVFTNKYGFPSYLHEEHNVFFLTDNIQTSTTLLSSYYTENPPIRENVDFLDTLEDLFNEQISQIQTLSEIIVLPVNIQEAFIENAVVAKTLNKLSPLAEDILDYYSDYITEENGSVYSTFLGQPVRKFSIESGWTDAVRTVADDETKMDVIRSGIFGRYKGKKKSFAIVNLLNVDPTDRIEASGKNTGMACASYQIHQLVDIVRELGITPEGTLPTIETAIEATRKAKLYDEGLSDQQIREIAYWLKMKKPQICRELEKWFLERDLII